MAPDDTPIADWLSSSSSDPAAVGDRYDEWAQSYDADLAAWHYQGPAVVADIVRTRLQETASVLDIGCGTGLVGRELRFRGLTGRLVGLDISQASLDLAQQSGAYDDLHRADLQQPLPLEGAGFDAAVCVGVMTYLPEVETVWRELARLVRPGGIVVVTQREDLWEERDCQGVVDRLTAEGTWEQLDLTGPAPYLPDGYGGTPAVPCYYLTAGVR